MVQVWLVKEVHMAISLESDCSGFVPGLSLMARDQYRRDVAQITFTPEEESKHFARILRAKAEPSNAWLQNLLKHSCAFLVEAYQPFVLSMARKVLVRFSYNIGCMELLDLVNEGNVGMLCFLHDESRVLQAVSRGLLLSVAFQSMRKAIRDRGAFFRLSGGAVDALSSLRKAKVQLRERLGRAATFCELARELNVSIDEVAEISSYGICGDVKSLQGLLEEDDVFESFDLVSVFASSADNGSERTQENQRVLHQALSVAVTSHQRDILSERYGLGDAAGELSRRGVSEARGVVKEVVAHHEVRGLQRLRTALQVEYEQGCPVYHLRDEYTDGYHTVKEVADLLGLGESTVRHWCIKGRFPGAVVRKSLRNKGWVIPKQDVLKVCDSLGVRVAV
jgi:RNA polymerase sigma factor (sigma-70 family)